MSTAVVDPVFEALGLTQVDAGGVRGAAAPVTLAGAVARPGPEKPSAASAAFPPYCAWPPPAWCGYAQAAAAAVAAASAYGAAGAGLPQGGGASSPLVLPEVLPVAAPQEVKSVPSPLKPAKAAGTPVSLMLATPPPKSTSGFRADAPAFVPGCAAETPSPLAGPRGGLCLFKELACESPEKSSSESKSFVEARAELLRFWCLAKDQEASEMPKIFAAVDVDHVDSKQRGEDSYVNDGAAAMPRDREAAGSLLLRLVKDPVLPASGRGQKSQAPGGEAKGAGKGQSRSRIRASAQAARAGADAPKVQDPITPSTANGSPTTSGADSDAASPAAGGGVEGGPPAAAPGNARRRRRGGRGGGGEKAVAPGRSAPTAVGGAGLEDAAKTQRSDAAVGAAGDPLFQ